MNIAIGVILGVVLPSALVITAAWLVFRKLHSVRKQRARALCDMVAERFGYTFVAEGGYYARRRGAFQVTVGLDGIVRIRGAGSVSV